MTICPTTIISGAALNERTWRNCTYIDGDLIIYRLDNDVTENELMFLRSILWVYGEIVIQEAPSIYSLSFLAFVHLANRIVLRDNPMLFDATLPVIHQEDVTSLIENCPMLCPFNYPVPESWGELQCKSPNLVFSTPANVSVMANIDSPFWVSLLLILMLLKVI